MTTSIIHSTEFYYDGEPIKAAYFFGNGSALSQPGKKHKIIMEINFTHPQNGDKIDLRVVKSILILCQPKEVIEVVVQREIREFIQLFPSIEAGNARTALQLSLENI